jgi:hypothetical protein
MLGEEMYAEKRLSVANGRRGEEGIRQRSITK